MAERSDRGKYICVRWLPKCNIPVKRPQQIPYHTIGTRVFIFGRAFALYRAVYSVYPFIHCRKECESYVKDFPGARFKKFSSNDEAESFVCGSDSGFSNNYSYTTPTSYVSIFLLSIEYLK